MIYDVCLSIMTLILLIRGIKRGLFLKIFDLTKLLIAFVFTPYFVDTVSLRFGRYLGSYNTVTINYIITFVLIILVLTILANLIHKFINIVSLGGFNIIMGGILGLVESAFISLAVLIVSLFLADYNQNISNQLYSSYIMYNLSLYTHDINYIFPEVIKNKFDRYYEKQTTVKLTNDILKKLKEGIANEN